MQWGMNFWIALPLVALISFLIGVGIERVILRPLHNAPVLSIVVVFIGLLAIFHSLAGGIWSHTIKDFPSPFPKVTFAGSGYIGPHQIGMIVGDARPAAGAVRLLPLHAAGARHARGGPEPDVRAAGRGAGRLDAGAGLGPGRGHRRGRRQPGGARRLPRAQHDGVASCSTALPARWSAASRARAAPWPAASSSACWRT